MNYTDYMNDTEYIAYLTTTYAIDDIKARPEFFIRLAFADGLIKGMQQAINDFDDALTTLQLEAIKQIHHGVHVRDSYKNPACPLCQEKD